MKHEYVCQSCFHQKICPEYHPQTYSCVNHIDEVDVAPRAAWISVDERLPDGNGRFLTVDKNGDMMVCYWEKRFGWFASVCNKNAITHWMPLPEPPKGASNDS